ncbi:MAG TPA: DsbA family protein [Pyrinomonadaceae bacterium]|nr:DsbA family protein [Pyrinomonadaceae bacterium]
MSDPGIVRLRNAVTDADRVSGPSNAPVTFLEYGNFECVDCGRAYPAIKQAQRLLGDNLRFVFRHFPTVATHPHALRAAEAAEAARSQKKFWQMHDELFTHQQALEDRNLSHYAARIGLYLPQFERDLAEHVFLEQIESEYKLALYDEHVTGTPTIYINEVRYTGARDVESLMLAIKAADTEGRIDLPANNRAFKKLLGRFSRSAGNL